MRRWIWLVSEGYTSRPATNEEEGYYHHPPIAIAITHPSPLPPPTLSIAIEINCRGGLVYGLRGHGCRHGLPGGRCRGGDTVVPVRLLGRLLGPQVSMVGLAGLERTHA